MTHEEKSDLIRELRAENERLKAQHEETLIKHAKEQHVALSSLDVALNQIKEQKEILTRAADALEEEFGPSNDPAYGVKGPVHELIAELRKAAE
jgi:hypothetical protein